MLSWKSSPSLLYPSTRITLRQRHKHLPGIVKVCSDIAGIPLNDHNDPHKGRAPEEERDQSWQIWVVPCGVNPCCCRQSSDTICHHVELKGLRVIHSCRSQPWKYLFWAQLGTFFCLIFLRIHTFMSIVDLLFTVNLTVPNLVDVVPSTLYHNTKRPACKRLWR